MRSIGKVKIKKLNKIIHKEVIKESKKTNNTLSVMDFNIVEDNVKAKIPEDWYNIWESAWAEINRLINDEMTAYAYGNKPI